MRNPLIALLIFFAISPFQASAQENDSIPPAKIRTWTVNSLGRADTVAMDTLLFDSHDYNPALGQINLGHLSSPMKHLVFEERNQASFLFFTPYHELMSTSQETRYIRTRYPFTLLKYSSSGEKDNEDQLVVRHSQNINENLNFGLDLNITASKKFYENERSLKSRFLNFFGSYNTESYSIFTNANINKVDNQELGGIRNKADFEVNPQRYIPGNLENARNVLKNSSFHAIQTLSLKKTSLSRLNIFDRIDRQTMPGSRDTLRQGPDLPQRDTLPSGALQPDSLAQDTTVVNPRDTLPSKAPKDSLAIDSETRFYLYHHLALSTHSKRYTDDNPQSDYYSPYPIYMDSSRTLDKAEQRSIRNEFKLVYSNRFADVTAGIDYDMLRYDYVQPQPAVDTPDYNLMNSRSYNNLSLTSSLSLRSDTSFLFDAQARYYLSGFNGGDLHLSGTIKKSIFNSMLTIEGGYHRYEPDYFYQHYNSNHFSWDQELSKTRTIEVKGTLELTPWKTRFSFKPSLIRYFTYLDTSARPVQYSGELQLLSASVEKDFQFWKFYSSNRVVFQYANPSDVLNLPFVYVHHKFAFRHQFNFRVTGGKLDTQVGWSLYYYPSFKPDGYMPALGMYHRQDAESLGNRPLFNVFANIQIQRTRLYIKLYHLNSFIQPRDYYTAPGYPMSPMMIKYGVSWSFYD